MEAEQLDDEGFQGWKPSVDLRHLGCLGHVCMYCMYAQYSTAQQTRVVGDPKRRLELNHPTNLNREPAGYARTDGMRGRCKELFAHRQMNPIFSYVGQLSFRLFFPRNFVVELIPCWWLAERRRVVVGV
jgi:hypothetical protein